MLFKIDSKPTDSLLRGFANSPTETMSSCWLAGAASQLPST
jgi:hypothetical protein